MMRYFEKFGHTCGLTDCDDLKRILGSKPWLTRTVFKWTSIDPSSEITTQFYNSYCAVVNGTEHHLRKYPLTIHPFSRFKFIWECFMASVFLIGLIYVPLQYLDYVNKHSKDTIGNLTLMKSVKTACIVDMFLRFFIGFVDEKKFIVSMREIATE
jgi:hypothetical protein